MKGKDCYRAVRRMDLEEAIDALTDLVGFEKKLLPYHDDDPRARDGCEWYHGRGVICSRDLCCHGHPSFRAAVRAQVAYLLRELDEGRENR